MKDLENWTPRQRPGRVDLAGRHVRVVNWDRASHAQALWEAFGEERANDLLFHFGWPQMKSRDDLADQLDRFNDRGEFVTCIFCEPASGAALGMASYMSIVPEHGRIETGAIAHGTALHRSRAATEGHYLMARLVFDDLGYRRYEWKLNNPNEPSHRAARRLGFTFEGIFRQHQVMPYGNRDTAWYSMLDHEWPHCKAAFEAWLDPGNFDGEGRQLRRLEALRSRAS